MIKFLIILCFSEVLLPPLCMKTQKLYLNVVAKLSFFEIFYCVFDIGEVV